MITLHDAQKIRSFLQDLEDIQCVRPDIPDGFLSDQDYEIRSASWRAAMDMAEAMIKDRLRKLGVQV
jgi:hypothetical protein